MTDARRPVSDEHKQEGLYPVLVRDGILQFRAALLRSGADHPLLVEHAAMLLILDLPAHQREAVVMSLLQTFVKAN